jgi:hypothetical protein
LQRTLIDKRLRRRLRFLGSWRERSDSAVPGYHQAGNDDSQKSNQPEKEESLGSFHNRSRGTQAKRCRQAALSGSGFL